MSGTHGIVAVGRGSACGVSSYHDLPAGYDLQATAGQRRAPEGLGCIKGSVRSRQRVGDASIRYDAGDECESSPVYPLRHAEFTLCTV